MTNLYFVRHAHSIYTPDELNRPLSERGFFDVKIVTKLLQTEEIGIVVSSPFKRAVQTVEGIAEYINKEVEIIDGFKERTLTTVPADNFNLAITKVWEDYNFSWESAKKRRESLGKNII